MRGSAAKRKKKKPAKATRIARDQDKCGYEGRKPIEITDLIVDPETERKTQATRNANTSPAYYQFYKKLISKEQFQAAEMFCEFYEIIQVSPTKSCQFFDERVDGGKLSFGGMTDRQAWAHQALKDAYQLIGPQNYRILVYFCAAGLGVEQITQLEWTRKPDRAALDRLRNQSKNRKGRVTVPVSDYARKQMGKKIRDLLQDIADLYQSYL